MSRKHMGWPLTCIVSVNDTRVRVPQTKDLNSFPEGKSSYARAETVLEALGGLA